MSAPAVALDRPPLSSIAVYVHIPYCTSKCPYCDFNSYAVDPAKTVGVKKRAAEFQEEQYTKALLAELQWRSAHEAWRGRPCHSLFFGGGTPSLFSSRQIGRIVDAVFAAFPALPDVEVTLEANPGTIAEEFKREKLRELRECGINRISMGVQSFNADKLKFLGRLHSVEDVYASVENLNWAGFHNYNLDLMFAVPDEQPAAWESDLRAAAGIAPVHISAYMLSIESGTEFDVLRRRNLLVLPPDGTQAGLYRMTQGVLAAHGYSQYEISNFSKPGFSSRHNQSYWLWEDYLALGAGAHSFIKSAQPGGAAERWSNIPKPAHYIQRALNSGDCAQRTESVSAMQAELEYLMCRLRTADGVVRTDFAELFGCDFAEKYAAVIAPFATSGLLISDADHCALTGEGFLFCDELLGELALSQQISSGFESE